jgi:acyl-CoA dehydrogenase
MPGVFFDVVQRAMHLHGALGISNEMPFAKMMVAAQTMAIADGPTEVHKITLARQLLRNYRAVDGLWPSQHIPARKAAARERYAELLEHEIGNDE